MMKYPIQSSALRFLFTRPPQTQARYRKVVSKIDFSTNALRYSRYPDLDYHFDGIGE